MLSSEVRDPIRRENLDPPMQHHFKLVSHKKLLQGAKYRIVFKFYIGVLKNSEAGAPFYIRFCFMLCKV